MSNRLTNIVALLRPVNIKCIRCIIYIFTLSPIFIQTNVGYLKYFKENSTKAVVPKGQNIFIISNSDILPVWPMYFVRQKEIFNITNCINLHRTFKVTCAFLIYQSFFIHQLMHKWTVLKTILKFTLKLTLKQLRHVSVQSPSSGNALFDLAKVTVVKIINPNTSMWLILILLPNSAPHIHQ
jgi:hypothetical protein